MEKGRLESLHSLAERTPSGVPAHNTDNAAASVAVCGCSGGKVQVKVGTITTGVPRLLEPMLRAPPEE